MCIRDRAFTGGSESDLGASISTNSFTRRFHADASADYQNTFGAHSIYSQFFGLSLGKGFLTESPTLMTLSFCILMALNVVFSNVWASS